MTKRNPSSPSLPEWVLHSIIAVLFGGILSIGVYVWNNREASSADEMSALKERVNRANDRQIELDRRLTVLETEFRIHQQTDK